MDGKRILLHIGGHKTGSTALQKVLTAQNRILKRNGIRYYSGAINVSNHVELHLAAMRIDRYSPAKLKTRLPEKPQSTLPAKGLNRIKVDAEFRARVKSHVRTFLNLCPEPRIIFSAEGLAFLRHPDELAFLTDLFAGCEVTIVAYLREKSSFLQSYRNQLERMNIAESDDPDSPAYLKPDSWILDYEALVSGYQSAFGADNVIVRNYESDCRKYGGTVGSFLSLLGLEKALRMRIGEPRKNVSRPS